MRGHCSNMTPMTNAVNARHNPETLDAGYLKPAVYDRIPSNTYYLDGTFGWAVGAANVDVFDDGQTYCCKIPRSALSAARFSRSPGVNAKLESAE